MSSPGKPVGSSVHSAEQQWDCKPMHHAVQSESGSSLQSLIANGILESPVTLSKNTLATPPNREKFRSSRVNRSPDGVAFGSRAKKSLPAGLLPGPRPLWPLIATHAKLEFPLTHSEHRLVTISNRNKKRVSAIPVIHEFRFTNRGSRIISHSSPVADFYRMRGELSRSVR